MINANYSNIGMVSIVKRLMVIDMLCVDHSITLYSSSLHRSCGLYSDIASQNHPALALDYYAELILY